MSQPSKILDKKVEKFEELYLVQMEGQPHYKATWIAKTTAAALYPTSRELFDAYDACLNRKVRKLKDQLKQEIIDKHPKNYGEAQESEKEGQDRKKLRRKPILKQKQKAQIMEQAKKELRQTSGNYTIAAKDFLIRIKTPVKFQSNWVFGDEVSYVVGKQKGVGLYTIAWENGTQTTVKEEQLMEKDIVKFCQFWEEKLNLRGPLIKRQMSQPERQQQLD